MKRLTKLGAIVAALCVIAVFTIAPLTKTWMPNISTIGGDGNPPGQTGVGLPDPIPVDITIKPETINLSSKGVFTVFIEFPSSEDWTYASGYQWLEGLKTKAKYKVADIEDLLVGEEQEIFVFGAISDGSDNIPFVGVDVVRVISKGKH